MIVYGYKYNSVCLQFTSPNRIIVLTEIYNDCAVRELIEFL